MSGTRKKTMALKVTALTAANNVKEFDCGNDALNTWLRQTASQHSRKKISQTHCLVDDIQPGKIIGFYTLAIRGMMPVTDLPPVMQRRLPGDVPAYTLARLAVSEDMQEQGWGEYLLVDAMQEVRRVASSIGGAFLFVDAKDLNAAAFYARYGFVPLPSNPLTLVLSLATLPA